MAHIPTEMKPLGYTINEQQGDWLVTYEVVGWNDRAKCNIWAEKKRKYSPRPSISKAIEAIDRDREWQQTKMLHRQITEQK